MLGMGAALLLFAATSKAQKLLSQCQLPPSYKGVPPARTDSGQLGPVSGLVYTVYQWNPNANGVVFVLAVAEPGTCIGFWVRPDTERTLWEVRPSSGPLRDKMVTDFAVTSYQEPEDEPEPAPAPGPPGGGEVRPPGGGGAPPPSPGGYTPPPPVAPLPQAPGDSRSPGQPSLPGQPAPTVPTTPPGVLFRMAQALATAQAQNDPQPLLDEAIRLRAEGYTREAQALEAEAASFERAPAPAPAPAPGPAPAPVDSRKVLAARVALEYKFARKGAETQAQRDVLRAFQTQEGLTADSKYGSKSAAAIIPYGIVPPTPLYWTGENAGRPAWDVEADKRNYKQKLEAEARKDPVRAPEWLAAATAVK